MTKRRNNSRRRTKQNKQKPFSRARKGTKIMETNTPTTTWEWAKTNEHQTMRNLNSRTREHYGERQTRQKHLNGDMAQQQSNNSWEITENHSMVTANRQARNNKWHPPLLRLHARAQPNLGRKWLIFHRVLCKTSKQMKRRTWKAQQQERNRQKQSGNTTKQSELRWWARSWRSWFAAGTETITYTHRFTHAHTTTWKTKNEERNTIINIKPRQTSLETTTHHHCSTSGSGWPFSPAFIMRLWHTCPSANAKSTAKCPVHVWCWCDTTNRAQTNGQTDRHEHTRTSTHQQ